MQTLAFRMNLHAGQIQEYRRRHDAVWPQVLALVQSAGVQDYSIFIDEETHHLFAVLKIKDSIALDETAKTDIMQQWWDYMADIMQTQAGSSRPVTVTLPCVFHMD